MVLEVGDASLQNAIGLGVSDHIVDGDGNDNVVERWSKK